MEATAAAAVGPFVGGPGGAASSFNAVAYVSFTGGSDNWRSAESDDGVAAGVYGGGGGGQSGGAGGSRLVVITYADVKPIGVRRNIALRR